MSFSTETITPAKAQEYLGTSVGNRPISKVFVRSYADTMKKGGWMQNGVPIIFDNEGHLIDGHHRLQAVIDANIPVTFDVRRGVPSDAFTTYDNGRHRNLGQILAMQGVQRYNMVAAIVNASEALRKAGRYYTNNTSATQIKRTIADSYNLYCLDRDGYNAAAEYVRTLESKCRVMRGSWEGGLYYYLITTGGYDESEVKPFFDELHTLDGNAIPAADWLRKIITREALEGKKLKEEALWFYMVQSWNAYIDGRSSRYLKYKEDNTIPALKLKTNKIL